VASTSAQFSLVLRVRIIGLEQLEDAVKSQEES